MEQLPFQGNDGVDAGGTAVNEVPASAALRDRAASGGRYEQSQPGGEGPVGRALSDAPESGGGRGRQPLRPAGQSCSGLSGRADSGHQPSAAAATPAAAAAATTGPSLVGLVDRAHPVRGGASSAAAGRIQLSAESDGSGGAAAALSVAPRPGPPPVLALSHGNRP